MVVDFQHHYIPTALAERYGARRGEKVDVMEGSVKKFTLHSKLWDIEAHVWDMEAAGVDMAVLSCPAGWDAPLEDCRLINDEFARLQRQYPGRIIGLAHVPVHEGRAGVAELERAVKDLGLRGTTMMSQVMGQPLDSPMLMDFYAKCVELDVPIFVHPAHIPAGYALAMDYDLARIIGRELDLALAVARLIAGGVLERFPQLKLVMGHFGGGVAAIKERLRNKAFRFGTRLSRPFDEYFDLLYFDMAGFEGGEGALTCALTGIRPERLVFATDYPQDFTGTLTDTGKAPADIRTYIETIRRLDLPEAAKQAMLGGTAARLLRL